MTTSAQRAAAVKMLGCTKCFVHKICVEKMFHPAYSNPVSFMLQFVQTKVKQKFLFSSTILQIGFQLIGFKSLKMCFLKV